MSRHASLVAAAALVCACAGASRASSSSPADSTAAWAYYAAAYLYIPRGDDVFVTPVFMADRDRLHLEARYNYEDFRTVSVWAGWNFEGGDALSYEVTAMAGVALGRSDGSMPGYRGALYWKAFDLSSEGEYFFDFSNGENDFFYSWSELGWTERAFRGGFAWQRTKVYESESEFSLGVFAGGSARGVDAAVYLFDPGTDVTTVMILAGFSF